MHVETLPPRRAARRLLAAAALSVASLGAPGAAEAQVARDYINIVGSSTVYPFSTVVAERFGRATRYKTPKIESTGSGGGLKLFCNGLGVQHPDVANSSRRITASEVQSCTRNGVTDIVEFMIGYDGIVLAQSKSAEPMALTLRDVYLALAKNVPDPDGAERLVPNPYRTWADVNPDLPAIRIEVLGPPPTSGTRDAFVELAMEGGCDTFEWIEALDGRTHQEACHTVREDGLFVEAGENDNLIVQKLVGNPAAVGIFGYSFMDQNSDRVAGVAIDGVVPTFDSIADGSYPVSRPLYFYAKKAHVPVIPGFREFLIEFTSEDAAGEFGYLSDQGLIPLSDAERADMASRARSLEPLRLAGTS
jgi:phosphate transport system substrate-binding protein